MNIYMFKPPNEKLANEAVETIANSFLFEFPTDILAGCASKIHNLTVTVKRRIKVQKILITF